MFDKSPARLKLEDYLRQALPAFLTWSAISAAMAFDVQSGRGRALLQAARRALLAEGIHFTTDHGRGLRRTAAEHIAAIGQRSRRHIRRTARHADQQMSAAMRAHNDIDGEVRLTIQTEQSLARLIAQTAKSRRLFNQVRPAVALKQDVLVPKEILRLQQPRRLLKKGGIPS